MREIKFRAWDKKTKKMRTVESIGFGELSYYNEGYPVVNMIGRDCINDKDIIIHRESHQHELMQYTGLKDKSGKEIYEGDIVELTKGNIVVKGQIVFEIGAFSIAMYEDDMAKVFGFNWNDNIKFLGELYWDQDCLEENVIECLRIICNIYENPELLEGN